MIIANKNVLRTFLQFCGVAGLELSTIAQKSIYDNFDSYSLSSYSLIAIHYQVVGNIASPKQIILID